MSSRKPVGAILAIAGLCLVALLLFLLLHHPARAPEPQPGNDFDPADFVRGRPQLDVPYVATDLQVVDAMLGLAQVKPDDYVIDLGSGDGRILISAARSIGAHGLGVDIDPAPRPRSHRQCRRQRAFPAGHLPPAGSVRDAARTTPTCSPSICSGGQSAAAAAHPGPDAARRARGQPRFRHGRLALGPAPARRQRDHLSVDRSRPGRRRLDADRGRPLLSDASRAALISNSSARPATPASSRAV